jgi:hypothetical protein
LSGVVTDSTILPQIVQITGIQTPNSTEEASPSPAPPEAEPIPVSSTPPETPPQET